MVLDELLGCKTINLFLISEVAKRMAREYKYVLSYIYDSLENIYKYGILELEKKVTSLLCKKMKPIIDEIEELKNYDIRLRLVHNRSE